MKIKQSIVFLLVIVFINLFVWFKTFSLDFYNDDFQILGFIQEKFASNPLSVFTQKDVSVYYYRPIPNFLITLLIATFDFNPLPFRIFNFLLYVLLLTFLFLFTQKLFNSEKLAFASTLLFSLLPSHDIFLTWIASSGDLLATLFILLAFFYLLFGNTKSSLFLSLLFFLLSILSKESTILAPFLAFFLALIVKDRRERFLSFALFTFAILVILFAYRNYFLEIDFLSSPNVANITPLQVVTNFFLYPFVLSIPTFAFSSENTLAFILNFVLVLSTATLVFAYLFKFEKREPNKITFGLLWYFWFVLPALPLFMRWYSLLPSLGIFFATTELGRSVKWKFLLPLVIAISSIFFVTDYYSLSGWKKSNSVAQKILDASNQINSGGKKRILLWFFPQYYNNYPILRSGIQQAINYKRSEKFEEVLFPVSVILTPKTKIKLVDHTVDTYNFQITKGTLFLNSRQEKLEKSKISNDYYVLWIEKQNNNETFSIKVNFIQKKQAYINYYFDGKNFIPFGE
ncbi:MAG: glycosyltransferase family 39 protein [Ignavibacteria bacterium]|nr:glycosyltransferase family 39 protein [Ignavibacteria bacterium]